MAQAFRDLSAQEYADLVAFPGTSWVTIAEPVPQGSLHRLRMKQGTVIPAHMHPSDEYVFVILGSLERAVESAKQAAFVRSRLLLEVSQGIRQGPHETLY